MQTICLFSVTSNFSLYETDREIVTKEQLLHPAQFLGIRVKTRMSLDLFLILFVNSNSQDYIYTIYLAFIDHIQCSRRASVTPTEVRTLD